MTEPSFRESCAWFGAISFEDRSLASLDDVVTRSDLSVDLCVALEYDSAVEQVQEDRTRRARARAHFDSSVAQLGVVGDRSIVLDPYNYTEFQHRIQKELDALPRATTALFDITCLTKIHTMALGALLSGWAGRWRIAYTIPGNYSSTSRRSVGWRDSIVAPFADRASFSGEEKSRGLMLLGFESSRLLLAFMEVETAGGIIVAASSAQRPDLATAALERNRNVTKYLLRLAANDWRLDSCEATDVESLVDLCHREIGRARQDGGPIVLYPFGPKALVFAAAVTLSREYRDASWFVYPVPYAYDVFSSEGIGMVSWLDQARFTRQA